MLVRASLRSLAPQYATRRLPQPLPLQALRLTTGVPGQLEPNMAPTPPSLRQKLKSGYNKYKGLCRDFLLIVLVLGVGTQLDRTIEIMDMPNPIPVLGIRGNQDVVRLAQKIPAPNLRDTDSVCKYLQQIGVLLCISYPAQTRTRSIEDVKVFSLTDTIAWYPIYQKVVALQDPEAYDLLFAAEAKIRATRRAIASEIAELLQTQGSTEGYFGQVSRKTLNKMLSNMKNAHFDQDSSIFEPVRARLRCLEEERCVRRVYERGPDILGSIAACLWSVLVSGFESESES